jgi:hypothetical protein
MKLGVSLSDRRTRTECVRAQGAEKYLDLTERK